MTYDVGDVARSPMMREIRYDDPPPSAYRWTRVYGTLDRGIVVELGRGLTTGEEWPRV